MRLLITTDTVGGVWRFGIELVQGLLEAGDSVALVSFGRAPSVSQHLECERLSKRWNRHFEYTATDTPLEWMQENGPTFEQGVAALQRAAQTFGAELLHSSQYCYAAAGLGIPAVVTAHSDVLSWAEACHGSPLEGSAWLRRYCALVQTGLDHAAAVVAPTKWMLRTLGNHFALPGEKRTIANGISIPPSLVAERSLQAVTAGRLWDEAKDISLLQSVRSNVPLVIAGATVCEGTEAPLIPNAQYCGDLPQEQLWSLFSRSAIYICTSRYEPFGLAPLEAALCGCAVVARDIEPLREVWADGAVFFSDADHLSYLLNALSDDPVRLRRQQQLSFARARQFTSGRMAADYRSLYASIMQQELAHAG
jgi:glycogen(starch) synthase